MTDAPAGTTCALLTRAHAGQVAGTAPVATGWLLVEQPGSWGARALTESGLDPAVGAALDHAAGDDVRVQLVRRPGRARDAATPARRTVLLVHAGDRPWAERLEVTSDDELAAIDPRVTTAATPPGTGSPVAGPIWLVCTHGKRDRCCATYGRPIADALAALHRDAVWETSHVGGHRFAGNLVCLPDGLVYGALRVAEALGVVDLHLAGRLELDHLRGRSGQPREIQAAEVLVRRHLSIDAADAVSVTGWTAGDPTVGVTVHVEVAGRPHEVTVRQEPSGVSYPMSCERDEPVDPGRWVLDWLA